MTDYELKVKLLKRLDAIEDALCSINDTLKSMDRVGKSRCDIEQKKLKEMLSVLYPEGEAEEKNE